MFSDPTYNAVTTRKVDIMSSIATSIITETLNADADAPGTFSTIVDGLRHLDPATLMALAVEGLSTVPTDGLLAVLERARWNTEAEISGKPAHHVVVGTNGKRLTFPLALAQDDDPADLPWLSLVALVTNAGLAYCVVEAEPTDQVRSGRNGQPQRVSAVVACSETMETDPQRAVEAFLTRRTAWFMGAGADRLTQAVDL